MAIDGSRWRLVGGIVLLASGCYAKGKPYVEPETSACTPLEAVETPVELGPIVGIGEDADGTVFLMDRPGAEPRVFVSSGDELFRMVVSGSGDVSDDGVETTLATFEWGSSTATMGVEVSEDATRLAVGFGAERSFEALLELGEELTPLSESSLDDYALRDFPGTVEIEYLARVETGERLVVLRPTEDWTYDDFRLFLGTSDPELLVERQVESVVRARDGGSTWIRFDFHGETAELSVPVADPATLTTASGTFAVELLPSSAAATLSFECLDQREPTNSPPPDGGA